MSSFNNDDYTYDSEDENIRTPDETRCERLIDENINNFDNFDNFNDNDNDNDINIALQKSLEEYMNQQSENKSKNQDEDLEYEKIIHQSLIDECTRIEKLRIEKEIEEYKIKEIYEKENKEFISKKESKFKYFISKLSYIIKDEDKRNAITHILKKYIYQNMNEKYIFLSNEEYDLFNKFMNYIYVIPNYQNRRTPLHKDDAEELIIYIKNNNAEFHYETNEISIKEINDFFNI